jgi:Zn-dependent protease
MHLPSAPRRPITSAPIRGWHLPSSRALIGRAEAALDGKPGLAALLSVLGFSFLGPVASLVLVATMLDHEFAHRYLMRRFGYMPGPVRLVPLVGAFVRARRPMLRTADIALIYLAGPMIGVLSAASAALLASHTLSTPLAHQVYLGAAVSIILNLFNLLPIEPLDGGLVSRVLPYPALALFPAVVGLFLVRAGMVATPLGVVMLSGSIWITARKVTKWRRYLADLRARLAGGDLSALRELRATFEVPLRERLLVVIAYALLIPGAMGLLQVLVRGGGWLH